MQSMTAGGARILVRWFRLPAQVQDGVLAAIITVLAQIELTAASVEGSLAQQRLSFLAMTAAVTWRRTTPLLGAVLLSGGIVAQTLVGSAPVVGGFVAMLIVTYSLGAHSSGQISLAGLVIVLAGVHVYPLVEPERASLADEVGNLAIFVGVWGLGTMLRWRDQRAEQMRHRAMVAETERDEHAHRAVAEERARIARELHDIVSHGVSTMVLQAEGAEALWERDPHRAREMLLRIQEGGRESMVELRRLLGLLRTSDERHGAGPPPGIADLEDLVGSLRAGGMPVDLQVDGPADAVPAALQLTVYRIVQEGLTNTLKHSGSVPASVRVAIGQGEIIVEVVDSGRGDAAGSSSGYGLVGLSERVTLFGGGIHAGPGPGGGFVLRAHLPRRSGAA